ncbi:hypothetical protein JOQ06_009006 [Pogonophryne albipinna]|uniref:SET domain-containing protein n=1 Tax=Pogonophryne albipinna TaxID=1090488 RepID=A0AAD6FT37_9TELE|nr:hypothetical protein JOQ06_009006 [Pogonophryne albipinna]
MRQLSVQGKPHLCLFADRDISPGEEITYNYGDSDWPWRCKMVKNSDYTESYMKTTGPVRSPLSRAEKWLGYECRECSQVWHKSCFRKIQDDNLHYLPKPSENSFRDELQSNQSDSEKDQISDECMSDEEYIPDSQGDDDDYSDAKFSVYNLEEAVKPANFQRVVQAEKKVSGFDDKHHTYSTPSLALKLGHTLLKISDIVHCRALMAEDDELIKSTKMFQKLSTSKWSEFVSHSALNTLSGAKYNKPSTLPFTEDVQILHRHLDKSAESAICNLKEEATPQNYAELAKVALAQIMVYNRRRTGEVSKMRLKNFYERDNAELHQDVAKGLSKTEQRLCNYFSRVEIPGKRGRKVAVLLSPSMLDALSLLVAAFLGHDIRVHRDFYRLPVPTTQLSKISKLLLTMEKGQLSSIQGKSLGEIDIEVSETAPPYEGKDHENARRTIKKLWAKDEVAAVMRHFKCHIAKGNLATKSECQHCKLVEGKVLDERTVQNVRDFVRNRGIARKRQSQ